MTTWMLHTPDGRGRILSGRGLRTESPNQAKKHFAYVAPCQQKRFSREHFTFARQQKRFSREHFAFARQQKRFPRCRRTGVVFRGSVHPPAEPQPGQARRSAGRLTPTMNATSILLASGPPEAPNTRSNFLQTPALSTLALNPLRRLVRLQSTPRRPVPNYLHEPDGRMGKRGQRNSISSAVFGDETHHPGNHRGLAPILSADLNDKR